MEEGGEEETTKTVICVRESTTGFRCALFIQKCTNSRVNDIFIALLFSFSISEALRVYMYSEPMRTHTPPLHRGLLLHAFHMISTC